MTAQLDLAFRDMEPSTAVREMIEEKVAWLSSHYDRITGFHVVVEEPHHRRERGNVFNLRIRIAVPGQEVVVSHEAHEDAQVVVRDAFEAARRQLDEYVRRRRDKARMPAP